MNNEVNTTRMIMRPRPTGLELDTLHMGRDPAHHFALHNCHFTPYSSIFNACNCSILIQPIDIIPT